MEYGIGTTIAALAFLFVIILIYITKEKRKSIENFIFNIMVLACSFVCISTISHAVLLKKYDLFIINLISWRVYIFSLITFMEIVMFYLINLMDNKKNENIKEIWKNNYSFRIMIIIFLLIQLITLFMPHIELYEIFNKHNIVYTTPIVSIIVTILLIYILSNIFYLYKKKISEVDKENKKSINIIVISLIFLLIQIVFPNTSIFAFSTVIITTVIYLLFSNPDIEMSKELKNEENVIKNNSKSKMNFLSNVTSEMKTPISYITSISTNLENLKNYDINEIKNTMQQIITSGNNLLDVVNNVLNINNIENGKISVINSEYKLNEIITDIINVTKEKIGNKPISIETNISPLLSKTYYGDAIKIHQALLSVLVNSAKYTDAGKITLTIDVEKISQGDKILFTIADTGNGIKEEEKELVFKKSERVENSLNDEIDGSGLGLAITKEYLELIDGKIWFESKFRIGTTFYIEIIQKPVNNIEEEPEQFESYNIDCSGLVALVLDDNKLNVKVIKRLLEKYGFKVISVRSGQECIYKIKSEEHFDIIFMDQVMEEMTGTETMKALRGLEGYKIPPLVLLTANAVTGMKEQYIKEGFDDYISKPITTTSLEKILSKFFKKTQ